MKKNIFVICFIAIFIFLAEFIEIRNNFDSEEDEIKIAEILAEENAKAESELLSENKFSDENNKKQKFFIWACQTVIDESKLTITKINYIKENPSFSVAIGELNELKNIFEKDISLMQVKLKRLTNTKFEEIDNDLFSEQFYQFLKNRYEIAISVRDSLDYLEDKIENPDLKIIEVRLDSAALF